MHGVRFTAPARGVSDQNVLYYFLGEYKENTHQTHLTHVIRSHTHVSVHCIRYGFLEASRHTLTYIRVRPLHTLWILGGFTVL